MLRLIDLAWPVDVAFFHHFDLIPKCKLHDFHSQCRDLALKINQQNAQTVANVESEGRELTIDRRSKSDKFPGQLIQTPLLIFQPTAEFQDSRWKSRYKVPWSTIYWCFIYAFLPFFEGNFEAEQGRCTIGPLCDVFPALLLRWLMSSKKWVLLRLEKLDVKPVQFGGRWPEQEISWNE